MALWMSGPRQITGWFGIEEVLDAHHLHAVRGDRVRTPAGAGDMRALGAHHERHVWTRDIGVEQADLRAVAREADREVDRHGGLAHAPLAGCNGDRVPHARDQVGGRSAERALDVARPVNPDEAGAEARESLADVVLDRGLERARRGRQLDGQVDDAAVDRDVLDHPERYEVAADLGILHPAERGEDVLVCQLIGHGLLIGTSMRGRCG